MRPRTIAFVIGAALIVLLFAFAGDAVLLVFASILLAVMLRAIAEPIAKRAGISPRWGLLITVALLLLALTLAGSLIAPAIADQMRELRSTLPSALQRLQQEMTRFSWIESLWDSVRFSDAAGTPPTVASKVTGAVSSMFAVIANAVIVIVIAIYLAAEPRPYIEGTVRLFPLAKRDRVREVLLAMGHTLRWWLLGKALSMLIVGVVVFIGLWTLGVPLAGALALVAGLLDFIPNVGPLLALAPAALFALLQGPTQVAYVLLLYAVVQALEGYLLTPLIEKRTVSLAARSDSDGDSDCNVGVRLAGFAAGRARDGCSLGGRAEDLRRRRTGRTRGRAWRRPTCQASLNAASRGTELAFLFGLSAHLPLTLGDSDDNNEDAFDLSARRVPTSRSAG